MQTKVEMGLQKVKSPLHAYLRACLKLLFGVLVVPAFLWAAEQKGAEVKQFELYKSKSCQCCDKWAKYMKDNGYALKTIVVNNMESIKEKYKIPKDMQSCHTTIFNGYFFEGHIPAEDIKSFLKKHPRDSIGLAVPGMPIGSPGMEQGTFIQPYNVYLVKKNGDISLWSQH